MLDVRIDAVGIYRFALSNCHLRGEKAVLGIILKVPAAEHGSVHIHRWCVPAGDSHIHHLTGNAVCELTGKLDVPCHGKHYLSAVTGSCASVTKRIGYAGRAVGVYGGKFVDRADCGGLPSALGNKRHHLVHSKFV